MNGLDDGTLYDRWRLDRDGDAFAELARRHSPVVFDLTCRVLGDRAGAEDVLQEALLSLALDRTRRPVEVGVVAWLARFAICRARNRRASERSRARRQIVVGLERPEESMPDERLELSEELERALAGCEPDERALLAMRFLHGWEYDRIAAALGIREGAARVRLHRALETVRGHVRERDAAKVAPALAAMPIAALPVSRLDAILETTVEIAKVHLGAPPNGLEHATAASRSLRVAVTLSGAALLFVGVASTAAHPELVGMGRAPTPDVASLDGALLRRTAAAHAASGGGEFGPAGLRGVPRPYDWDLGVLRGASTPVSLDPPRAPSRTSASPAPAAEPAPPVPAAPVRIADAERVLECEEPPNASRPMVRGACAAKGDPVSSDGERAGAFGGSSSGDVTDETPARAAAESVSDADAPHARRTFFRPVAVRRPSLDELPESTQALMAEAEGLIRDMLAASADGDESGEFVPATVRGRVRVVRKQFGALRRDLRRRDEALSPKASRARQAAVRQVLSLLTQVVLADGRTARDLRFPAGVDLEAALQQVIRVFAARPAGDERPAGAELPSGAETTDTESTDAEAPE